MKHSDEPISRADQALRILEIFADSANLAFDRLLAARAFGELERSLPGDKGPVWAKRLVEVGDSVDLRLQSIDCSIDQALTLVRQGIPVATYVLHPDGTMQWILLRACRGRRVRLELLDRQPKDLWCGLRKLLRLLDAPSRSAARPWVVGQPALACDAQSARRTSTPSEPLGPLARLLALLRPEWSDLWVILTFSLVAGVLALAIPIAVESLVDTVAFGRYLQPIIILAILLFTFLAFAAAMRGLLAYVVELIQRRLFVRVVADLAYRLPRVRQQALDKLYGPEILNYFFDVVTLQKVTATMLLEGLTVILQAIVGMIVLAFYHPFLLGFDIVLLLLMTVVTYLLGIGAVKTSVKESKAKFAVGGWLEQLMQNPTAFKLNSGMRLGVEKADQLVVNYLDARRSHWRILIRQILFALGVEVVAATALLGLGGWLVISGQLTLGQLVAAELIVMMIVGSFAKFGKHLEVYYDLTAAVDKLGKLFDLPVEPHNKLFHLPKSTPAALQARDLSYAYDKKSVLNRLTFQMASGEQVAVVGEPGSGKSTLVDLICGVRPPASGHVELDGIDLRELRPDALRQQIGVARAGEIFHGTIDENVHLGRTGICADDVREALDAVGLLDDVLVLPDGLNSMLYVGGVPLSATQVTRLVIARAIVSRPRLLLIDGTLDYLDDQTALFVLDRLTRKPTSWSLLLCTGRQALIDRCGRAIRLGVTGAKPGKP
jgi:putative ABC transport system ATP-binding protein